MAVEKASSDTSVRDVVPLTVIYERQVDPKDIIKRVHRMERASNRPGEDEVLVFPGGISFQTPPFTHGDLKSYLPVHVLHSDLLDSDGL